MTDGSWSRSVFEQLYKQNPDPWSFETSPYENSKYIATLAHAGPGPFDFALELGCSIGVLTASLAPRCHHLLAVDIAETALANARLRCASLPNVIFHRGQLPEEFPLLAENSCDLILISELLYFLSPTDIARLARQCLAVRRTDAPLILVNWTGKTDTPCTGNQAAELFIETCLKNTTISYFTDRADSYRIDRLT
ncbi:class I SAM-dependent methyltransferase [Acetobacter fallax]|uniref:Methyltransferase domain-containing protein n=1 Tax=Acetobacter fallax TaxID=1737473 RepID=A0ABX0KA74_9PROT|nr:class I SAM-dependent methyltransferase [Acetobacter fallax]NHO31425.1 methyltransferase domain-containing protein [Acetobacter fallax]NHO34991.1 methyltransferase domain-containing protein [Acetobacter fallax]